MKNIFQKSCKLGRTGLNLQAQGNNMNTDIHEWCLNRGIDPVAEIKTNTGRKFLSKILEDHFLSQFETATEKDNAILARIIRSKNLREQQIKSEYDYPINLLRAISCECHLGLADIEQVLNAMITVFEKQDK